ncbi:MAG: FAD-dependent oxidoreductase, partial [Desulfobacteraceae bacterium]
APVESIAWYRHQHTVESEGIGRELENRAIKLGRTHNEPQSASQALDTEMFKYLADQLVSESGITPLLHCFCTEVIMDGTTIKGVITESKSGRRAILAKRIIDATGDADIANLAGAPWEAAAVESRMGVSVGFACSGVNRERFLDYVQANPATYKDWAEETSGKEDTMFSPYLSEPFLRARQAGEIPENVTIEGTWSRLTEHGEATYLNMIYMHGFDTTSVTDLTRAEIQGRQQAIWAVAALKKYVPGFEGAALRNFGMSLGTRESRKIIGRSTITGFDVKNQARFDDSIGICPEFLDAYGTVILPTTGRYFQVPYGIMVPGEVDNLLVAGRCVAGDQVSHGATRQIVCCTVTGQAAGTAAALSIQKKVPTSSVAVEQIRARLEKEGIRTR